MTIRRSLILLLVVLWGSGKFLAPSYGGEVYHGRVTDAANGEPLEGAVVVVVWYKKPIITMDGPRYFHSATEGLTGAMGEFSVDGSPGIDWNPFTYVVKEPTVVIYKPGYEPLAPWTVSIGFRTTADLVESLKKGAIIKLPKLKTKEKMKRFADVGSLVGQVPYEKIPHLVQAVNIQRRLAGITSLYPEPATGGKVP